LPERRGARGRLHPGLDARAKGPDAGFQIAAKALVRWREPALPLRPGRIRQSWPAVRAWHMFRPGVWVFSGANPDWGFWSNRSEPSQRCI